MAIEQGNKFARAFDDFLYEDTKIEFSDDEYYEPRKSPVIVTQTMGQRIQDKEMGDDQSEASFTMRTEIVDEAEFKYLTHDAQVTRSTTFVTGKLNQGTRGVAQEYTVTDASIFFKGQIALNPTTGEQFYVVSRNTSTSPQEVTMEPAFFQTGFTGTSVPPSLTNGTSTAPSNGQSLIIISNANGEASGTRTIYDTQPIETYQYVQIIKDSAGETWSHEHSRQRGKDTLEDMMVRKKGEWLENYEDQLIFGDLNKQTVNNELIRTFQGIFGFISTNTFAASGLVGSGNDLSYNRLNQFSESMDKSSSNADKICLVGGNIMRKIQEIMNVQVQTNVQVGDKKFGLKGLAFETAFRPLIFINHPKMTDVYSNRVLAIDPKHITLVNQEGLGMQSREIPETAEHVNKEEWYGYMSTMLKHEESFGEITSITTSFS